MPIEKHPPPIRPPTSDQTKPTPTTDQNRRDVAKVRQSDNLLILNILKRFLKQFYIKYSRRGALSVHVRIKKVGGGVGGGSGEILAYILFLSFFQINIERSAKDSDSTFASKSCALTRQNSCIHLLPNLSA